MSMEDDDIEYDFVIPTTCCNDYDWEDNDIHYNLENIFSTCLEEYDNGVCYTIGAIHAIDKNYYDDMQNHKLRDDLNNEYDPLIPSNFHKKIYYDDSMPPIYDDYIDKSGFGRVSPLGSSDPTILEGVESY